MSKFIQFKTDVGDYKAGAYAEVADPVAKQFIDMRVAEAAPEDPIQRAVAMSMSQMTAVIEAQAQKQLEEQKAAAKKYELATRDFARPKHKFEVGHPDPTSEKDKIRNRPQNEWFRSLVYTLCQDVDPEIRQNARNYLTTPYEEGGWGCMKYADYLKDQLNPGDYARAMSEGTGSLGGYTTPVLYESQVYEIAAEMSIVVPRAQNKPMGARQVEYPALNQYLAPVAGQSAFFGGMEVFRRGELQSRAEQDLLWKKIQLLAQDLTAYTEISRDLIQDATIPIDAYVVRLMGEAIGWREDWESINGTGEGMFLGVLNAPATLALTRHSGGAPYPTTGPPFNQNFDYSDLVNMKSHMLIGARDPVWIIHPSSIPVLAKLQDTTGRYLFIPYAYVSDGVANVGGTGNQNWAGGIGGTAAGASKRLAGVLLGDPVFVSEKVPVALTTTVQATTHGNYGDIMYVDCNSYWVGRRSGLEVGLSEHYLFKNDELAIRAKIRNDGKPGQLAPITLADGSFQVSGFVTLAGA